MSVSKMNRNKNTKEGSRQASEEKERWLNVNT